MRIKDNKIKFAATFVFVFFIGFVCSGVFSRDLLVSVGIGLLLTVINSIILYVRSEVIRSEIEW